MKAVLLKENQQIAVEEVREPELLKNTDVIIKIIKSAICGSDIHIKEGMIPVNPGTIMGHEFMGVVESVGSDVARFNPAIAFQRRPRCGVGHVRPANEGKLSIVRRLIYGAAVNCWGLI